MSYVVKHWNSRKVHVVRDEKGKFSKRVSERTMNSLVAIMLLVTLWCLGFFLHTVNTPTAHAAVKITNIHGDIDACYYAKYNYSKITNPEDMVADCAKVGVKI